MAMNTAFQNRQWEPRISEPGQTSFASAPSIAPNGLPLHILSDEPILELELALMAFNPARQTFLAAVCEAARVVNGTCLFELPAQGLMDNCERVAAVHLSTSDGPLTVFACLETDGESIRLERAGERHGKLTRFARSFLSLLQTL